MSADRDSLHGLRFGLAGFVCGLRSDKAGGCLASSWIVGRGAGRGAEGFGSATLAVIVGGGGQRRIAFDRAHEIEAALEI